MLQAQAQAAGGEQGMCAIALYDYQAAAEDEISFDPNDIITNIEMVSLSLFLGMNCSYVSRELLLPQLSRPLLCPLNVLHKSLFTGGRRLVAWRVPRQIRTLPCQLRREAVKVALEDQAKIMDALCPSPGCQTVGLCHICV